MLPAAPGRGTVHDMDPAVALAQAYLYANQYFTVTEYPIVEAFAPGRFRSATDIDVIAVRFPEAARFVPGGGGEGDATGAAGGVLVGDLDPRLRAPQDRVHIVIAEVKEGQAELNRGGRDPRVLEAVLRRVGRYGPADHATTIEHLLRHGVHDTPQARVSMVAFGTYRGDRGPYTTITFARVIRWLRRLARGHWDVLQNAQFKDPALAFLMLLEKSGFDRPEAEHDGGGGHAGERPHHRRSARRGHGPERGRPRQG
jgi:hypothetical protein